MWCKCTLLHGNMLNTELRGGKEVCLLCSCVCNETHLIGFTVNIRSKDCNLIYRPWSHYQTWPGHPLWSPHTSQESWLARFCKQPTSRPTDAALPRPPGDSHAPNNDLREPLSLDIKSIKLFEFSEKLSP